MNERKFKRFSYEIRLKLEALYNAGVPVKQIVKELGYHNSSIYRELRLGMYEWKNHDWTYTKKYSADIAERKSRFNISARAKDLKVGKDYDFIQFIENLIITKKYSPEAALAFIRRNNIKFDTDVSVRTIYRYIDNGVFLHLTRENLPFRGKRKRKVKHVVVQKQSKIGTSIEERPKEISLRSDFGHWELDSVIGKKESRNTLLVFTERLTRMEFVFRSRDKSVYSTVKILDSLERRFGRKFKKIFKTITCDNGIEFKNADLLERSCLGNYARTKCYFCHPYSSWERGSNEKQNQMLRRYIAKGTKIESYSDEYIKEAEDWLNDYPRRIFDYKTSAEMFEAELRKIGIKKII